MNSVTNDRGETVIAVGAPGSYARVVCERPKLIADIAQLIFDSGIKGRAEQNAVMIAAVELASDKFRATPSPETVSV